jgi:hypothetical protein
VNVFVLEPVALAFLTSIPLRQTTMEPAGVKNLVTISHKPGVGRARWLLRLGSKLASLCGKLIEPAANPEKEEFPLNALYVYRPNEP